MLNFKEFKIPYLVESIGLIGLICLTIIITLIRVGVVKLVYPIGSVLVIAIPILINHIMVVVIIFLLGALFNLYISYWVKNQYLPSLEDKKGKNRDLTQTPDNEKKEILKDSPKRQDSTFLLTIVANSMETGILQTLKQLGEKQIPIKYKLIGIIIA